MTIVGVMPGDFAFPYRSMFGPWVSGGATTADLWIPMPLEGPRWLTSGGSLVRNVHSLVAVGRLAPGVSIEQARADLAGVAAQLEAEFPETNRGWGTTVVSLMDQTVGGARPALLIALAGVSLILAHGRRERRQPGARAQRRPAAGARGARGPRGLASPARGPVAHRERDAIAGRGRGRTRRGSVGRARAGRAGADRDPADPEVSPDARVVAITLLVAVGTGPLIGLIPALAAGSSEVGPALQDHSRGAVGSRGRRRLRLTLVIVEVALAVLLTTGAGLLLRSFLKIMDVDPGFRADSL